MTGSRETPKDAPTPSRVRVCRAAATLDVPAHDYRLVPASWVTPDGTAALAPLLAEHGAVLFEGLAGDGAWTPAVLFEVDVAWSVLDAAGSRRGVETHTRGDRTMALVGWELCDDVTAWDSAPAVESPAALRSTLDAHGRRVWEIGSARLGPHPILPARAPRDWAHAWTPAWGPLDLTVTLDQPREALTRFLEAWSPMPYVREDDEHELVLREPSGHERAPMLVVRDGQLAWYRSYLTPSDAVAAFDAGLLAHLCAGELGPLRWTLTDEDFGHLVASGDDAPSLQAYLT